MAKLNINGRTHDVKVEADTPLLWAIREQVGLTGTKYGCGVAQCGACSVHINGEVRRSIDKGDGVAHQLRGLTLEGVYKQAARITGISVSGLMARFEHLNPGMQRMNLGNMIRKVYKDQAAKGAK